MPDPRHFFLPDVVAGVAIVTPGVAVVMTDGCGFDFLTERERERERAR